MLLFVPLHGDAGARRPPWATIGLVAGNVAVAALLGFPETFHGEPGSLVDRFVLRFGRFDPLTWLPAAFTHVGWVHVVSNMLCLWASGLVVEALLGARRFLVVYLLIAAAKSALGQLVMLGASGGGVVGASGAIAGVMALAALWAPRSTLTMFVWAFHVIGIRQWRVLTVVGTYFGVELVVALLGAFRMSSELSHLMGAAVGLAVGLHMLRRGLVDTGGWDWLSLRHGPPGGHRLDPPGPDPREAALRTVREALDAGAPARADAACVAAERASAGFRLPRADLLRLAEALREAGLHEQAAHRLEELADADAAAPASLRLALVEELLAARRTGAALERVAAIDAASLSAEERARRAALERRARESNAGGLELA